MNRSLGGRPAKTNKHTNKQMQKHCRWKAQHVDVHECCLWKAYLELRSQPRVKPQTAFSFLLRTTQPLPWRPLCADLPPTVLFWCSKEHETVSARSEFSESADTPLALAGGGGGGGEGGKRVGDPAGKSREGSDPQFLQSGSEGALPAPTAVAEMKQIHGKCHSFIMWAFTG